VAAARGKMLVMVLVAGQVALELLLFAMLTLLLPQVPLQVHQQLQ